MGNIVLPQTAVRHRLVFELKYENGELYWDRCGRVARKLVTHEGWAIDSIDINGCHIRKDDQNLTFSFSPTKLDLSQSQSQDVHELLSPGEFAAIAEEFSEVVVEALDLSFFPRIGFRLWTLYATDSLDDASSRVSRMSLFAPCEVLSALGDLSFISHSVVISRPSHMIRIAVTPFEQQVNIAPSIIAAARARAREQWINQRKVLIQKLKAKKAIEAYPPLGIMVDMDACIEEPPYPKQVPICRFIDDVMTDFSTIINEILSVRGK